MKNIKNINISPAEAKCKIFKNPCLANSLPLASLAIGLRQAKACCNCNKPTATLPKGTPSIVKLCCNCHRLQTINCLSDNRKKKLTGLVAKQLLVANLEKKNNWPGLVFLQKRGSGHANPNPNIISYKFPGAMGLEKKKSNGLFAKGNKFTPLPSQSQGCFNNSQAKSVNNLNRFIINNVYKLLFNFFKSMYCLISKPVFITTQDKIKIQLFYFVASLAEGKLLAFGKPGVAELVATSENLIVGQLLAYAKPKAASKVYLPSQSQANKFKLICGILSKFFNKTVELELIRLHKPYYDSTILVNFLALIINKKNIANCIKKLYDSNIIQQLTSTTAAATELYLPSQSKATTGINNNIENSENKKAIDLVNNWLGLNEQASATAAYLAGLNIKISGRLMREAIVPRITTKKFEKGFTANGKINYSDVARFTHKNRKGAFTITIKSGQKF